MSDHTKHHQADKSAARKPDPQRPDPNKVSKDATPIATPAVLGEVAKPATPAVIVAAPNSAPAVDAKPAVISAPSK